MKRGSRPRTVCRVSSVESPPRRYAATPSAPPRAREAGHEAPRPVSTRFSVLMLVAALAVFAAVYVAGSLLDVGVLHSVALLGAAGALMTAFMAAALHES